ncbi:hypothetical protein D3C86_535040 [compost metagenome]
MDGYRVRFFQQLVAIKKVILTLVPNLINNLSKRDVGFAKCNFLCKTYCRYLH